MSMRVIIAEDERLAREEIVYLLEQEKDISILSCATNGRELLSLVDEHHPDVVFLDIQMPEMEGIQAARMLAAKPCSPLFVFTTAHEEYALEAFGLDAVDYLLKPYDHHRLKETLKRLRNRLRNGIETNTNLDHSRTERENSHLNTPTKSTKLLVEDGKRLIVIDPESILYLVKEDKLLHVYTTQQQTYTTKSSLQEIERRLRYYAFLRTHRSYLVNLNHVLEIVPWFNGAYNLVLKDEAKTQIPVSRYAVKELFNKLSE